MMAIVPILGLARARPARTQPAMPAHALSLADALAAAEARAPGVRLAELGVGQARARSAGAAVILPVNPRLLADARPPITSGGWRDLGYAVTGELTFDVGGAPGARLREAARAVEGARASLAVARRDARTQAWERYVRAKAAELRVAETRASEELARRVLEAMRLREDLGASGDIDASTAALDVALLAAAGEEARFELGARTTALREAVDWPASESIALTTSLDDPPPSPSAESILSHALRVRPELAEARARAAVLRATDLRLAREAAPHLGLYGGVDAAPLSPVYGVVGVSVDLPIAQRNQGPRARVARDLDVEAYRFELDTRRIEREVRAASEAYEARRAELAQVRDRAMPAAERAFALIERGWKAGRFDVFRLTAAARDVVRVRARHLDVLEAAWLARVELDRAAGGGL
jgi:cobalt-zinc-cadmium efflux system outer membrane protein